MLCNLDKISRKNKKTCLKIKKNSYFSRMSLFALHWNIHDSHSNYILNYRSEGPLS